MKVRLKKKIIGFALLAIAIFISTSPVEAKQYFFGEDFNGKWDFDTGDPKYGGEGVATGGKCTTVSAISKYDPSTVEDFTNKKITIKVKDGKFKAYVFINSIGEDINPTYTFDVSKDESPEFSYDPFDDNSDVKITIAYVLAEKDNLCGVFKAASAYSDDKEVQLRLANGTDGGYVYLKRLEVGRDISNALLENTNYNGICKAFREGDYAKNPYIVNKVKKEDFEKYNPTVIGDSYYQDKLGYCYNEQVKANFKESDVATMIKFAIQGYKTSSTTSSSGSIGIIKENAKLISSGNPDQTKGLTNIDSLQCPAYIKNTDGTYTVNDKKIESSYYIIGETHNYQTLLSGKKISCDRKCMETITIDYGPPVATRGGMCFEYKVKVISEVNCETKVSGGAPKLSDYDVCTPIPACVHDNGWVGTGAGPNINFDLCVNECDGGKYSQECIDSCYSDIYEPQSSSKLLSYNSSAKVEKLAEKNQDYYDNILKSRFSNLNDVKEALKNGRHGKYIVKNGKIYWDSGSGYFWDRLGRYYTDYDPSIPSNLVLAQNRKYDYSDSFARKVNGSSICGASCSWVGCNSARQNGYYKDGKATTGQFLNEEEVVAGYEVDMETYTNVMKECKAAASCSTTTATFTINVDNKLKDKGKDKNNLINYDTATLTPGNGMASITDSDNIIIDRDFCYNAGNGSVGNGETSGGNSSDTQKYMTEWSFPGTWINNKTGEISYEKKTDTAWHEKKEKFCTNLNSANVNTSWWKQRVAGTNVSLNAEELIKDFEYNIKATTSNFGYYDWNVNIECFYAIYDKEKSSNSNNSPKNNLNYNLRPVDLEDVFPSTEGEETTNSAETGRDPGFNWTNAATNLKNSTYRVTPGALTTAVQSRGNTIYQDKDQYLDYEFILDQKTINKIRNSSNKSYATYDNNFQIVNGVSAYKSNLITELASTRGNIGCNNDGTGSTCEEIDNEYTEIIGGSTNE